MQAALQRVHRVALKLQPLWPEVRLSTGAGGIGARTPLRSAAKFYGTTKSNRLVYSSKGSSQPPCRWWRRAAAIPRTFRQCQALSCAPSEFLQAHHAAGTDETALPATPPLSTPPATVLEISCSALLPTPPPPCAVCLRACWLTVNRSGSRRGRHPDGDHSGREEMQTQYPHIWVRLCETSPDPDLPVNLDGHLTQRVTQKIVAV
jgi:hypothetical protein